MWSFTHRGAEAKFWVSGTPTGTEFVLVHGIGMGHGVFRGVADLLAPHGMVYAIDLPGFGDSPEPAKAQNMATSGAFFAEFVRALSIHNPVLIGHSMGTQVVASALGQCPGLATTAVLIAPVVNPAEKTALRQAARLIQDLADESIRVLWLGLYYYLKTGPKWFMQKLRMMLNHDFEATLPTMQARTLVVRGIDDRVCPRDWVQHVASLIPNAIFHEVEGCGHEAMLRRPEPIATLILEHAQQSHTQGGTA